MSEHNDTHAADQQDDANLYLPKDLYAATPHLPRRIPGESAGDFESRAADLPPLPDEMPPGQEGGQAGINDITYRAGFPQRQAGAEEF